MSYLGDSLHPMQRKQSRDRSPRRARYEVQQLRARLFFGPVKTLSSWRPNEVSKVNRSTEADFITSGALTRPAYAPRPRARRLPTPKLAVVTRRAQFSQISTLYDDVTSRQTPPSARRPLSWSYSTRSGLSLPCPARSSPPRSRFVTLVTLPRASADPTSR